MSSAELKKALRRRLKEMEVAFPREAAVAESARIWEVVESLPEYQAAHNVLIYMDIPGEVMTRSFIADRCGCRRFVLPLVSGDDLLLKEYSPCHLVSGYRGIMEPSVSAEEVDPSEIDLAVVPGLAFCADGRRMGRGRGFYDRLLPSLRCPKIGVCYSFRLLEDIPCDPWDARMDMVVSGLL